MRILKLIFSRFFFVVAFMLFQFVALVFALVYFNENYVYFQIGYSLFSLILIIYIINKNEPSAFKNAWIITVALFPIYGVLAYILFSRNRRPEERREELSGMRTTISPDTLGIITEAEYAEFLPEDAIAQARYLEKNARAPLYGNTETKYFPSGEELFEDVFATLRTAKHYIYLEYFIVNYGSLWDELLQILTEKAACGVDVRLIYDDFGSIMHLPQNFPSKMEERGIKCAAFRRFIPVLTGTLNNRDHRKICIVDGHTAYTGGANLSDEYVNRKKLFGHWKDCGVRLRGDAVYSFTVMFMSMWNYIFDIHHDETIKIPYHYIPDGIADDGFVVPYSDSPVDDEAVGQSVYLNMLGRAKRYVYICTPYLILDDEMISALSVASKSGVDVRIVTPGVPDKVLVNAITKAYYEPLLKTGVRIFEYIPGFVHSKTMVCDDEYAVCGTINLDYRSLFLNHECAVWMYGSSAIPTMRDDFLAMLSKCAEITPELYFGTPWYRRLLGNILRIFAPLS